MAILEGVGGQGSFFTDGDLTKGVHQLFRVGSFDEDCIRHASYELRLNDVHVAVKRPYGKEDQTFEEFQKLKWLKDGDKEYVDLQPKQIAMLYTQEYFQFPENVIGLTVGRGLLFTVGLTPENTYIDPGFSGHLYITVVNHNLDVVRLHKSMRISRLFIFKLTKAVDEPYVSGSDSGITQQLKTIPVRQLLQPEELQKIQDSQLLSDIQKSCSIGDLLLQINEREKRRRSLHMLWLVSLTIVLLVLVFGPAVGPVFRALTLPKWLPKELAKALITVALGGIPFLIKYFRHRRSK